jgi:5-(carboxyamino)imidazole ribonucleotide synthase
MLNLLGDLWFASRDAAAAAPSVDEAQHGRTPPWDAVLALPGAHLHLYGKLAPRRGRKMGHLTITADTLESALATARVAASRLGLPPPG